jgi:hypothetical protein
MTTFSAPGPRDQCPGPGSTDALSPARSGAGGEHAVVPRRLKARAQQEAAPDVANAASSFRAGGARQELSILLPDGETTYQGAPNWFKPCPVVSPRFASPT